MAFTVLSSLAQTIDRILSDSRYPVSVDGKQRIESIYKQVTFLQQFLQSFPKEAGSVERRIWDAANEAEDIIEHFMYEQDRSFYESMRAADAGIATTRPKSLYDFHELKRAVEDIDSVSSELLELGDVGVGRDDFPAARSSSSTVFSPTIDNIVVGFHEELRNKIMYQLRGQSSKREVISIVGMGGIGKTTLARMIYDNRLALEYFDVCGWTTLSQDYKTQSMISDLLDSIRGFNAEGSGVSTKSIGERSGLSKELIGEQLYKYLKGRRYFIVLDDVWSVDAWYEVMRMFPDDNNGSRIILTTRLSSLAYDVSSSGDCHQMCLLNADESWNFLGQMVFKQENFPLELKKFDYETENQLDKIGREIARSCGGLPLAIVLIAGILSTVSMTPASWEKIQENLHSTLYHNEEAHHLDKILSLSYAHLSHHLRPCFLYIGSFPEDYEIRVSKLVKLWIGEGFVKPSVSSRSYEEIAEAYVEDLVNKSLVLVTSRKANGRIKTCSLHDLVRDISRRKAQEENIKRRVSIAHSDLKKLAKTYASTIRSVICFEPSESSLVALRKCRLLRVLDVNDADVYSLPAQVFELFHLRYLAFSCPMKIPAAISMLQNLQTLIICPRKGSRRHSMDEVFLPLEIWNMPLLRHLVSFFDLLPDPDERAASGLQNLQTLSVVKKLVCTKTIMLLIHILKKFEISYFGDKYYGDCQLENLVYLRHLETLKLINYAGFLSKLKVNPVFPELLKKLTLSGWGFPWEFMRIVGSLPHLQVLKLRDFACKGNKWETTEGEFPRLEYLLIDKSDLQNWITDYTHFPGLKCLVLYRCSLLDEIPTEIGDIPTLEVIEIDRANESIVHSAKRIQMEQEVLGNNGLQVRCVQYHYQGF